MASVALAGKNVLLTGASRGIGRALALRLGGAGCHLACCGRDRAALADLERLLESEARIAGRAARVFWRAFDLRDEGALLRFYREARDELGPPDILINNAGANPRKAALREVTTEEFDATLALNLRAPFLLMRQAFDDLAARRGQVVNILSTACHTAMETMGAYTAAKKGLEALTDVFRKEARPHGIRVTSIYPGGTDTTFRAQPRPDYLRPESVAEAIVAVLTLPAELAPHQFTFRPEVETNF